MVKKLVSLTHTVTLTVEAENEEQIWEWLMENTPEEAITKAGGREYNDSYEETIEADSNEEPAISLVKKDEDYFGNECRVFFKDGSEKKGILLKTEDKNTFLIRSFTPDTLIKREDVKTIDLL